MQPRPNDARTAQVWKAPEFFGAKMEHPRVVAGSADCVSKRWNALCLDVAEKSQRQVKLVGPRPTDTSGRQGAPQFILRLLQLVFDLFRHRNCDEQAESFWNGVAQSLKLQASLISKFGARIPFPLYENAFGTTSGGPTLRS